MSESKADAKGDGGEPIIIKKYANRRLYNTRSSSYITLEHLAQMTRENVDFKVVDAKSGDDITHSILTQIIMDEEAGGEKMLPTSLLRQLIGMYGNSMQALVPKYLETSMDNFRANQSKIKKAIEDSLGATPIAQLAQRNVEAFKAAATVLRGRGDEKGKGKDKDKDKDKVAEDKAGGDTDEIAALRAQMAEMQRKLDTLGK